MNKLLVTLSLAAAVVAAPAAAVSYDAFTSFNGVNGSGSFNYGFTDNTTLTSFNVSATNGLCALGTGSTCLYYSDTGNLPQASIGGSYSTVAVPANAILVHPGNAATLSDYIGFVAPNAGSYTYTINLESVGTDTGTGTGYRTFTSLAGVVTSLGTRSLLPTYTSTGTLTGTQTLALGEVFGVIVDFNGDYGGDSTGVNFSIATVPATVPEPATWGLMIVGFGMVGFSARRRRNVVAA